MKTVELTNRLLIQHLSQILQRSLTSIDYTFELKEVVLTEFGKIETYLPVANKEEVPQIYIVEHGGRMFFGISPDGFTENTTEFYYKNFGNLLYPESESITKILNNTSELHEVITIHEDSGDIVCEKTIEHSQTVYDGVVSYTIYESTNKEDDRAIIVIQTSVVNNHEDKSTFYGDTGFAPDNLRHFVNFLEGEVITNIDIKLDIEVN